MDIKRKIKVIAIVMLVAAIGVVLAIKPSAERSAGEDNVVPDRAMPLLVDVGADKCVPCKAMMPVLDELKAEYAEVFQVKFVDVWENPEAQGEYGIRMIPTQIFYGADGTELFRHEGFFAKADILEAWRTLGIVVE